MALTTLSRVKRYWNTNVANPEKDALLTVLIEEVSDAIERYCDRSFALTTYNEWYCGGPTLSLRQFPVKAIFYVGYSTTSAATLTYTGNVRWSSVSANKDEIITSVMDTGTPLVTRYPTTGKSVGELVTEIAADPANPNWTAFLHGDFHQQPAFMLYPFSSWDARVGTRLLVPALPLSVHVPQNAERTIETICPDGTDLFVYYQAGYTLPSDGNAQDEIAAEEGDVPPSLMHLAERCVVEAYGTSVDYQYSKKIVFDWLVQHAREFVPFRKLSM